MFKFFTLLVLLYSTLFSADLTITDGFQKSNNFTLKYYDDENSLLTIDEIEKIVFKETLPSQFTMGYKYNNVWFKIEIENHSKDEDFVLYFTESIWSTLDLYTKEGSQWKVQKNGLTVARYGGEEFIVLLTETGIGNAVELAERIRANIENNHIVLDDGKVVHITVSIGATQLDTIKDKDIEMIIKRCDKALYESKNKGRNMVSTLL